MLELDIIGAWDARAVNLDQEEADRNVYEFDLTLWNLLSTLAKERPDDAASQFSLGMDTVQKLSLATPSQLEALASGVLISFKLETAEQNIITRLSGDYDPVVFINHSVDEFDAAYWLLFNRVASRDPEMAKEVFGVSRELAELVAKATDSQLRHMSGTTVTHFTLRFAPSIIEEILDDSREELTHPVLKNCNSLYRDVGGGDEHWQLWYIGSLGYSSTHGPCWVHHKNHHDRDWSDLQTGQTALPGSGEGRIYSGTKIQNFPGWCDTDS
ncbi:TPA: transcriptional regulator [Citrobacter freundii]